MRVISPVLFLQWGQFFWLSGIRHKKKGTSAFACERAFWEILASFARIYAYACTYVRMSWIYAYISPGEISWQLPTRDMVSTRIDITRSVFTWPRRYLTHTSWVIAGKLRAYCCSFLRCKRSPTFFALLFRPDISHYHRHLAFSQFISRSWIWRN